LKTILHIIDTTGPGGAETVFLELAQATNDKGYKSLALIRGPGWVESQLKEKNIDYVVMDCRGSLNYRYLMSLIKLVKQNKVNVIQTHLLGSAVYGCLAGFLSRTPVFCTFHGMVDISDNERLLSAKLLAIRLGSKKLIAVTDQIFGKLMGFRFFKREKVQTVYNGINMQHYKKKEGSILRGQLGIGADFLIGSVGNIRQPKNYILALETISKLHEKGILAHYLIAGQGSESQMQPLKDKIKAYDLQAYIHLMGFVEDIPQVLSSLDLFLMTSSSEGHPLAITQAMANGVPIVSTPSGVEEIVVHGEEALISSAHTVDALIECISSLYGNFDKSNKLIENAKQKAENSYSLDAMVDAYFHLYGKI
jgi:glycosyltransferase involved in cell wall biosynthesis